MDPVIVEKTQAAAAAPVDTATPAKTAAPVKAAPAKKAAPVKTPAAAKPALKKAVVAPARPAEKSTNKPIEKPAAKTVAKVAKPAAKPAAKPVAKPVEKAAKPVKAEKVEKAAKPPKAAKPAKADKLVRDSFTIPRAEYTLLQELKARSATLGQPAKKSEVLRAGILALKALDEKALLAVLAQVPVIKTGRPSRD